MKRILGTLRWIAPGALLLGILPGSCEASILRMVTPLLLQG